MKELSEIINKLKVAVRRLTDDNLGLNKEILRLKNNEQQIKAQLEEVIKDNSKLKLELETLSKQKETEHEAFQDSVMKDVAGLVDEIDRCIALVEQNG